MGRFASVRANSASTAAQRRTNRSTAAARANGWTAIALLGAQMQAFAAGDEEAQTGALGQQLGHQRDGRRGGGDQLLEIVQHQQYLFAAQVLDQAGPRRFGRAAGQAQRRHKGRSRQLRMGHCGQGDETGAIPVERLELRAHRL